MTNFELWEHLKQFGQMRNSWWYDVAVYPVTILSLIAFLLMVFAIRNKPRLISMLTWIIIAGVPMVMLLPSYFVSNDLLGMLKYLEYKPPASLQQLDRPTTLLLGSYLSQLAQIGIWGGCLTIFVIFSSLLVGYVPGVSPLVQEFSQKIIEKTRKFGQGRKQKALSSDHGIIKVTRGDQRGTHVAVIDKGVIGKDEPYLAITNEGVSRRHAYFEIRDAQPYIVDTNSTNGTYIVRFGTTLDVDGQGVPLQHGDKIYLGDPGEPESVELLYEQTN